jgi:hypothetical protein
MKKCAFLSGRACIYLFHTKGYADSIDAFCYKVGLAQVVQHVAPTDGNFL